MPVQAFDPNKWVMASASGPKPSEERILRSPSYRLSCCVERVE
ncbi:MAG: hypothetical protein ACYTFG_00225 [Planctomycetota bacterium]